MDKKRASSPAFLIELVQPALKTTPTALYSSCIATFFFLFTAFQSCCLLSFHTGALRSRNARAHRKRGGGRRRQEKPRLIEVSVCVGPKLQPVHTFATPEPQQEHKRGDTQPQKRDISNILSVFFSTSPRSMTESKIKAATSSSRSRLLSGSASRYRRSEAAVSGPWLLMVQSAGWQRHPLPPRPSLLCLVSLPSAAATFSTGLD